MNGNTKDMIEIEKKTLLSSQLKFGGCGIVLSQFKIKNFQ